MASSITNDATPPLVLIYHQRTTYCKRTNCSQGGIDPGMMLVSTGSFNAASAAHADDADAHDAEADDLRRMLVITGSCNAASAGQTAGADDAEADDRRRRREFAKRPVANPLTCSLNPTTPPG